MLNIHTAVRLYLPFVGKLPFVRLNIPLVRRTRRSAAEHRPGFSPYNRPFIWRRPATPGRPWIRDTSPNFSVVTLVERVTSASYWVSLIKTCLSCIAGWAALATAGNVSAEVRYSGLDAAQEANARVVMPLAAAECTSARWRVERLFRDADKNLRGALEALGYYEIDITKSLSFEDDCWRADLDVIVGEPVVLRNVEIEIVGDAAADTEFGSLIEANKPLAGRILDHGRYAAYKTTLLSSAIARGYFDAEFLRSEVTVDPAAHSADIEITLSSGARYRFGEIKYTEGILRENLMRGFSDIRGGDYYRSDAINELYEVLNGSTYFGAVSISTEPVDAEQKTVPVNVELQPGTRRIYSVGAGFTTDTGPHGRLGYANRRRNDKGHQFESKLFASSVRSELTATYRWPRRDPWSRFAAAEKETSPIHILSGPTARVPMWLHRCFTRDACIGLTIAALRTARQPRTVKSSTASAYKTCRVVVRSTPRPR